MEFTKSVIRNFNKAQQASTYSSYSKHHLGAVIFYKNKVISVGWNTNKELLLQRRYNVLRNFDVTKYPNYGHAEMCAIHKMINTYDMDKIDKSKLSIYIWRGRFGKGMMSRPCAACQAALKDFGIKNIYYTGNDSFVYEELK